ncbi:GL18904 [Drosophila persimilis]|uniref:GL18904 n=1 Tax=Drosophila persimilis TaxID=7234 RepID=B4G840_DROPE|nr:GL18904 [Drosophila persimilis]
MDRVSEKHSQFVKKHTATEISVAHYTGRIIYDTRSFTDINRDFVPPEMIETFRSSLDESIMLMFTNQLTKAGNLTMPFEAVQHKDETERRSYWAKRVRSIPIWQLPKYKKRIAGSVTGSVCRRWSMRRRANGMRTPPTLFDPMPRNGERSPSFRSCCTTERPASRTLSISHNRNQVQQNMNAYNNAYNNYNSSNNPNWGRSGSRRNSLKGYAAPPPPPPMPSSNNYYRNNPSQQPQRNYQQRSSYPPSDPIRELQNMARNDGDNSEDPPFNFKAMLRKTNYPRGSETSTYDFNNRRGSDAGDQQHTFQAPKLRSTGRRFEDEGGYKTSAGNYGAARNFGQQRAPPLNQSSSSVGRSFENSNARSFEQAGSYVEEEIAPGVTLSGYAVDI